MLVLVCTVLFVTIVTQSVIKYVFENTISTFQKEHVGMRRRCVFERREVQPIAQLRHSVESPDILKQHRDMGRTHSECDITDHRHPKAQLDE